MNLNDLFELTVRTRPRQPALDYYDSDGGFHTITFDEVDRRSRRMAIVLYERGLRAGDRLCAYLANSVGLIDLYLACVRTGIIFVPINILYKQREVAHILEDAGAKAVVVDGMLPAPAPTVWQLTELGAEAEAATIHDQFVALDGDSPAAIIYTSGTTGVSKGAVLTHNNLAANAIVLNTCWQISHDDRLLLTLPLFHVHGLGNGLHCWLLSGCRMQLQARFDQRLAEKMFSEFRPTVFLACPPCMCGCWRYPRLLRGRSAVSCGCSFVGPRRCRHSCLQISKPVSNTGFWSDTA
jgi:malonyl-CoA/methylmalonyl-CoA synthetase